ncbi:MAG: hypothetical protein F4228_12865 [Acidobacteria bacterium]|nr:hypothetical protein [Acidobacteriota bacterium]MYF15582.1 hypothetical protein [Acidobacteriota bacterium]MYI97994.1 hypothetical protein [Acidobacteriota bacterium]
MGRRRRRRAPASNHRPVLEFARGLGYRFQDLGLLEEALTHGSYRNDHAVADYERLEFVGDAALGLVVTESMHFQRPQWDGQRRQETKSELVSNQSLAAAARALALDEGIRVGRGRNAGEEVRSSDRILANVFEAVLGAAYLDGGMPAARGVLGAAFRKKLQRLRLKPPEGAPGWVRRAGSGLRSIGPLGIRFARRLLLLRKRVERALGYTFANPGILAAALDAGDAGRQRTPGGRRGRKRRTRGRRAPAPGSTGSAEPANRPALRFLGRDVMHLVLAEALHDHFPEWDEGRMTLARMRLQSRDFTRTLNEHWSLGDGDDAAATAEAVMGALYLDGSLGAARRALGRPFATALEELRDPDLELLDPKTLLQNRLAQAGKDAPKYEPRRAPRNSRSNGTVSVTLRLADGLTETGVGRGLKEAEKDAARRVLERLERRSGRRRSRPGRGTAADPPAEAAGQSPTIVPATENPKGALQEALVKKEGRLPVYRLISESGPEHEKTFVMEVLAGRRALGRGIGPSKRKAEAEAAAAALASGI